MPNHTLDVPVLIPDAKDCTACAERLRNRLASVQGIAAAELDPPGRRLTLKYDPALLSIADLEVRVKEAGLAVTNRFRHATLRLEGLVRRVDEGGIREVILAPNPSMEGEVPATYIQQLLAERPVRVTRLARGLPMGGELEDVDGGTLAHALVARQELR